MPKWVECDVALAELAIETMKEEMYSLGDGLTSF